MRTIRGLSILLIICLSPVTAAAQQAETFDELEAQEEFRNGVLSYHSGFFNDAVLSFQRSIAANPEHAEIRNWLARAYAQSGFWDAAMGEWEEIISAGEATLALQQRYEIMQERTGLVQELAGRERFVMAASISGHSPEYTLFRRPTSIRPLPDGTSIVVAFGNHVITVLDPNGNRRREFLGGVGGFDGPYDILPLSDGTYLVSEFMADRVSRINERGDRMSSFGSRGRGDGEFLGPQYMDIDERDHVYITDWGNRVVRKFTADGEYLFSIGREQTGFDGLERPTGVVWWNRQLWVADSARGVIEVFDESGNHLRSIRHERISNPQSLTAFDHESLMIVDSNRVLLLNPRTDESMSVDDPSAGKLTAASLDANGNIVAVDHDGESMIVFTPVSQLYAGMHVSIQRIHADAYPEVTIDLTVENRAGEPIVGLDRRNFVIADPGGTSQELEMVYQGWRSPVVHTTLLLDMHPDMQDSAEVSAQLLENLYEEADSGDTNRIVSAASNPVLEVEAGAGAATASSRVNRILGSAQGGEIDQGIRFAADELLSTRGRRHIILVTDGGRRIPDFQTYGTIELARYLNQNHIQFSILQVGSGDIDPQLQYIMEETGGTVVTEDNPRGSLPLLEHVKTAPNGWYTLRYTTAADSDFGRRFIPISIEGLLLQRSGRDELGYFAPLQFD